ncbi:unnamed protein product, partial [Ectocarpus fasciculatus]
FRLSAEKGHVLAQFNLGLRLVSGDGIEKDLSGAALWFEKAAENGHAGSQYMLAICYLNIDGGIARNCGEVERLLLLAANQDHVDAMYELGLLFRGHYKTGCRNHLCTYNRFRLYTLAADKGHTDAIYAQGLCYKNGQGVPEDSDKALIFFRRAALQGHCDAQFVAGLALQQASRDSEEEDAVEAVKMFSLAGFGGNDMKYRL